MTTTNIKKNFFGFNLNTATRYSDHIKVSVNSCIQNTDLDTHFMYCGHNEELLNWLESKPIKLIDVSDYDFIKIISNHKWESDNHLEIAKGAWQRLLIPEVCSNLHITDEHILYTDVDVMFMANVCEPIALDVPRFACSREGGRGNVYNTGVMIMNLEYFKQNYTPIIDFVVQRNFDFPAFDQGALNAYINMIDITILNHLEWNLNSYMNSSLEDCKIFHFHGPKYEHIYKYVNGDDIADFPEIYQKLLSKSDKVTLQSVVSYFDTLLSSTAC